MNDDRLQPATKGDLLDLEQKFSGQLSGLKDELVEAIRDSQTEVLRAFYGFSQTVLDRFKEEDQTEAGLKRRMATIESRIFEIEKRLNMPPSGV
jgi:hypothetical protein